MTSKKRSKKKPSPAVTKGAAPIPPAAAGTDSPPGDVCSAFPETLNLAATEATALEIESNSSCGGGGSEASTYPCAFNSSSSGTASTSSFYGSSSSVSVASSSAAGDERRDLALLLDAFGSATIDQVDSSYREAGGDLFLAASIMCSLQDLEPPQPPPPPDPSPHVKSCGKKSARKSKKIFMAASGMVADVIGKGYSRPSTSPVSAPNAWKNRDRGSAGCSWNNRNREGYTTCGGDTKNNFEETEQFLCSMLGYNSEIGMGVVRDVLGQYGYDVEKALDALLDISGFGCCFPNAEKNTILSPTMFPGDRLSEEKLYLPEETPNIAYNNSEKGHEFFWEQRHGSYAKAVCEVQHSLISPSRSTVVNSKMPQQVLESLFKIPEQCTGTYEPSKMDLKKIMKKLQSYNYPITRNNQEIPKYGDEYREFRGVAERHYNTMKGYYQKAALAYSKGEKSYASCLSKEGKHYNELARKEDENASRKIFEARNRHITNTVTIDLHGQHVKQAMKLLKVHMLACVCMPSTLLRVITGCGGEGSRKGKIKQSVMELVKKENIEWYEGNSGTIVLRLGGPREYLFMEHDID